MVSVIKTQAVAIRKGTTEENEKFTGALGELSADLGYSQGGIQGVDFLTTVRLHNGVNAGGIPLARADTRNITSKALAEERPKYGGDRNLAYACLLNMEDLTNPEVLEDNRIEASTAQKGLENINLILSNYGMVNTNLLTTELLLKTNTTLNNINTADLAEETEASTGQVGKKLAYLDTSNINTKDLAEPFHHDGLNGNKYLAYYDMTNVNTSDLIRVDRDSTLGPVLTDSTLSNVNKEIWQGHLFNPANELFLEVTTNKDTSIALDGTQINTLHYPTTKAVHDHVENRRLGLLHTDYTNSEDYSVLYQKNEQRNRCSLSAINNAGQGFKVDNYYYTGQHLKREEWILNPDDTSRVILIPEKISIQVRTQGDDETLRFEAYPKYSVENLAELHPQFDVYSVDLSTTVTLEVTSTFDSATSLYINTLSLVSGSTTNFKKNDITPLVNDIQINSLLYIKPTQVSGEGGLINFVFFPEITDAVFEDTTCIIYNDTDEAFNGEITFHTESFIPLVGGGNLLKRDLSNLPGMSLNDTNIVKNANWRISSAAELPELSTLSIPDHKYEEIATVGAVWTSIKETKNEIDALTDKLNNMHIPAPEFFTGTNTLGQVLLINETVDFDLYVNGQFQYPGQGIYSFNSDTKEITLNFAVENTTENGIAVIYRGLKK